MRRAISYPCSGPSSSTLNTANSAVPRLIPGAIISSPIHKNPTYRVQACQLDFGTGGSEFGGGARSGMAPTNQSLLALQGSYVEYGSPAAALFNGAHYSNV